MGETISSRKCYQLRWTAAQPRLCKIPELREEEQRLNGIMNIALLHITKGGIYIIEGDM